MNYFGITLCLSVLAVIAFAKPSDDKYTNKFDGLDYQEIAKNDRLLNSYFDCIIDGVKCTADGKELKGKIL